MENILDLQKKMNREIKFRAWDKKENYFMVNFQIMPNGDLRHCIPSKRNPNKLEWTEINGQNIVLMQFTGLKDKNGKEIYEGDIVSINSPSWGISVKVVEWEFSSFWVGKGRGKGFLYGHLEELSSGMIEVIGNIYENPELFN